MIETTNYLPDSLKALPIWVLWRIEERDGKWTKVPYNAQTLRRASSTDNRTWTVYDIAVRSLEDNREDFNGLGVMITKDYRLVFVDVDHCITDGLLDERGRDLLETFTDPAQYIELSQSRSGLHALVLGEIPRNFKNPKNGIEMYSEKRFCALTGIALSAAEPAEDESSVRYWFERYKTPKKQNNVYPPPSLEEVKEDRWIIEHAAERDGRFKELYSGGLADYESHSEADIALLLILAFWTDRNPEQMDRLFRSSGLYRAKWERGDYREKSIAAACGRLEESLSEYGRRQKIEEGRKELEWFDSI